MLTRTGKEIRIPRSEWDRLKKNPSFVELVELLEDRDDLQIARKIRGKDLTLSQYLEKRGIQGRR
jgi:hypothetical protein